MGISNEYCVNKDVSESKPVEIAKNEQTAAMQKQIAKLIEYHKSSGGKLNSPLEVAIKNNRAIKEVAVEKVNAPPPVFFIVCLFANLLNTYTKSN